VRRAPRRVCDRDRGPGDGRGRARHLRPGRRAGDARHDPGRRAGRSRPADARAPLRRALCALDRRAIRPIQPRPRRLPAHHRGRVARMGRGERDLASTAPIRPRPAAAAKRSAGASANTITASTTAMLPVRRQRRIGAVHGGRHPRRDDTSRTAARRVRGRRSPSASTAGPSVARRSHPRGACDDVDRDAGRARLGCRRRGAVVASFAAARHWSCRTNSSCGTSPCPRRRLMPIADSMRSASGCARPHHESDHQPSEGPKSMSSANALTYAYNTSKVRPEDAPKSANFRFSIFFSLRFSIFRNFDVDF
jgi:hypothetical protein